VHVSLGTDPANTQWQEEKQLKYDLQTWLTYEEDQIRQKKTGRIGRFLRIELTIMSFSQ